MCVSVQMIMGLRNGEAKFKGFAGLLQQFFVTPVSVLADQVRRMA